MKANVRKAPPGQTSHKLDLVYAGIHLQEDRDARFATRAAGVDKKFWHMIRVRVPLGTLSTGQYLALDDISERVTYNRSLRVTAGQSIQLHGLAGRDLDATIEALAEAGLAAGCDAAGFEFAVAVSPVPVENSSYLRLRALAAELCDDLYPHRGKLRDRATPSHSPRKFTVGLGMPGDNSANVFANDVGLLLVNGRDGDQQINIYAGGSLSMPGRRPDTYARLASPIGSVPPGQVIAAVKAVAAVFKRHGQLATRRHTRLKYIVDALGVDQFRAEVEQELGFPFSRLVPHDELQIPSWYGAQDQHNGEFYYGLGIPYGRIRDHGITRYKSAMRLIVESFRPRVILSPDQNIILAGLRIEHIKPLEQILSSYHIPFGDGLTRLRFEAMACAGLPTCPLALAESERVAPRLLDALETELIRLDRKDSPFSFRISGCSIGCIRPNMVDLGAIGRKPGHYDLYVGGSEADGRFGELYEEMVPLEEIIPTVRPLLELWARCSKAEEPFSDFYVRWFGSDEKPLRLIPCDAVPARERVARQIVDTVG
ncbi:MAG TPA: hypothetical protein VM735_03505 [Candidatus Kapabacteria bacterium]|nr:hypothetical protein [Candidatus Kapabacteria bacterium]